MIGLGMRHIDLGSIPVSFPHSLALQPVFSVILTSCYNYIITLSFIMQRWLFNLSLELNSTVLLPPERLVSVNETLTLLEGEAAENQEQVDAIADQVRQLEESADQLRERYTQLQQHRDLLRRILRNIEGLDCRKQFASP